MEINKDNLLANGWVEVTDGMGVLMEKPIENRNPINDTPEDTDIKLILHHCFNVPQLAVLFPDGGMLNFNVQTIEELNTFEGNLNFYDCPY